MRGRTGAFDGHHDSYIFADGHARGQAPQPQSLYTLRFDSAELWGKDGEPGSAVYVDLWEEYLGPAAGP